MSTPFIVASPRPLLSIVGPTATGKSGLAFILAERLLAEGYFPTVALISADSRQVYRGLEIVSGADIPADFEVAVSDSQLPHFVKKTIYGEVQLHGVSMIEPTTDWSLASFQQFALPVIYETWRHGGLPIVVGGTGLYHQRLFADELASLPGPDEQLRAEVAKLSVVELQQRVQETYPAEYAALTRDDQHNARRLIRVLEKSQVTVTEAPSTITPPTSHYTIGLNDTIEQIEQKIALRVADRLKLGAVQEVQQLLVSFGHLDLPVLSATGVKELALFIQEKIELDECRELWTRRERQYAKRQQTWWKKNQAGWWFEVGQNGWAESAQQQLLASLS